MNVWPNNLSEPVFPLDNTRIAAVQSAMTRDGQRATWSEARAYALEHQQDNRSQQK